jgi:hypothetical protein
MANESVVHPIRKMHSKNVLIVRVTKNVSPDLLHSAPPAQSLRLSDIDPFGGKIEIIAMPDFLQNRSYLSISYEQSLSSKELPHYSRTLIPVSLS